MEDRAKRKNLRVTGVTEEEEGRDCKAFKLKLFLDWSGIPQQSTVIERAHSFWEQYREAR